MINLRRDSIPFDSVLSQTPHTLLLFEALELPSRISQAIDPSLATFATNFPRSYQAFINSSRILPGESLGHWMARLPKRRYYAINPGPGCQFYRSS